MKKINKKIISLTLVSSMLVSYIVPITKVFASGSTQVAITINVDASSDVTLTARNSDGPVANNVTGDGLVGIRGESDNNIIGFNDTTNNSGYSNSDVSVVCSSNKSCVATITVPEDHGVKVGVGGDTPFGFTLNGNEYFGTPLKNGATVVIVNKDIEENNFNGDAYLVWSCGNKICYHLFHGLSNNASFVQASTITADNDSSKTFDVHAEEKFFAPPELFATKKAEIDANTIDINSLIGPEGIDYMPVGEPSLNNAYTSYGNRNFKITIYGDEYRGVSLGSLSDLKYYPSAWTDDLARIESYDISGTTKENPTDIDTVLLEPTVNIKALNSYNGFEIAKIEALDVPTNAVTITKANGEYKLKFSSNFYDKVVFKVTSTNNETYYLRVNRLTLGVNNDEVIYRPNGDDIDIIANFYFDRTTSYEDYILTAKIEYKDGSTKVVKMVNAKEIDDGFGNKIYAYELDDQENPIGPSNGKGLKTSTYKYTIKNSEAKNINKVYINAEYKGSTSTNYAGAFAGSGKGIVITFKEGK